MTDITYTQNDTYPAIVGVLQHDGAAVDVTGASVRFHLRAPGAESAKVTGTGEVRDGPAGEVAYQWVTGDLDTSGVFFGEFQVTYSDGNVETFPDEPLEIYVRPELG